MHPCWVRSPPEYLCSLTDSRPGPGLNVPPHKRACTGCGLTSMARTEYLRTAPQVHLRCAWSDAPGRGSFQRPGFPQDRESCKGAPKNQEGGVGSFTCSPKTRTTCEQQRRLRVKVVEEAPGPPGDKSLQSGVKCFERRNAGICSLCPMRASTVICDCFNNGIYPY